jgi:hypothetical protein
MRSMCQGTAVYESAAAAVWWQGPSQVVLHAKLASVQPLCVAFLEDADCKERCCAGRVEQA